MKIFGLSLKDDTLTRILKTWAHTIKSHSWPTVVGGEPDIFKIFIMHSQPK